MQTQTQIKTVEDILVLPYAKFKDRRFLPDVTVVYFALDEFNRILYIGKALDLRERWSNHHKIPTLEHLSCERIYWANTTQDKYSDFESDMIDRFQPCTNDESCNPLMFNRIKDSKFKRQLKTQPNKELVAKCRALYPEMDGASEKVFLESILSAVITGGLAKPTEQSSKAKEYCTHYKVQMDYPSAYVKDGLKLVEHNSHHLLVFENSLKNRYEEILTKMRNHEDIRISVLQELEAIIELKRTCVAFNEKTLGLRSGEYFHRRTDPIHYIETDKDIADSKAFIKILRSALAEE